MEIINLDQFVEELNIYNTFIVDGQLCLGEIITNRYKDCGIKVLSDLNCVKWIVREWEVDHIIQIEKTGNSDRPSYKVIFDPSYIPIPVYGSLMPKNITCYNRNDIESIPAEDCGTDFLRLIDKDIFDDTTSFILEDSPYPVAVIGLDLRKLQLNNQQKLKIAKELNKVACYRLSPRKNDSSETLCLVVEIEDYRFSFQGLDVNTLDLRLLYISDDYYHHEKVKEYTQKMVNSYNLAYKNAKINTDLIKELSELTDGIKIKT